MEQSGERPKIGAKVSFNENMILLFSFCDLCDVL